VSSRAVALVTCRNLPALDADDRPLVPALADLGVTAEPAVWDDPQVDWARFDLAVIRSPWDYMDRRDRFLAWAATVPRLVNPAPVLAWNTVKTYLADMAAAGLPVVPTRFVRPGEDVRLPDGEYVLKPAIGVGSRDAGRYGPGDAEAAAAHLARLGRAGQVVLVQPYLAGVDRAGETSLVFLGGRFSHAITKGAMLSGPDGGTPDGDGLVDGLYRAERIRPRTPSAAELAVGEAVVAVLPSLVAGGPLAYARVDLLPGPEGPVVLELELTEPSLFLGHAPGAVTRLAAVIAGLAGRKAGGDRASR
jgi:glutathione synthase/RimK-type ligase-like ATP-grasp enzyme